jgi:hypothetical protein
MERPVPSQSPTLSDWTGSFAEYTPAPHLSEWTGPFTEYTLGEYYAHIFPPMYAHSAGHIQLNLINAIAFTPEQLRALSPHRETRLYIESS